MELESRHQCLIYEGAPSRQLPALAAVIQQKLNENYRCLYLNSPAVVAEMHACLAGKEVDVAQAMAKNSLILSSDIALAEDGRFDTDLMIRQLEDAIDDAMDNGYKGLFATGDMTWEFGPQASFTKLLEYEWRLEKLFHQRPELCGICQYHGDTLSPEVMRKGLLSHKVVFINETLSRINQHYAPSESQAEAAAETQQLDQAIESLVKA